MTNAETKTRFGTPSQAIVQEIRKITNLCKQCNIGIAFKTTNAILQLIKQKTNQQYSRNRQEWNI